MAIKHARVENGRKYWEVDSYEVVQLVPAGDVLIVWYEEDADGVPSLRSEPADMLALAKVTTAIYSQPENSMNGADRKEMDSEYRMVVVALALADGFFYVANEYEWYAGMMRDGDDIRKATGYLEWELVEKLEKHGVIPPTTDDDDDD